MEPSEQPFPDGSELSDEELEEIIEWLHGPQNVLNPRGQNVVYRKVQHIIPNPMYL